MADYTAFLRSPDIFQPLPEEELARIASRLKDSRIKERQDVFRQGDPGEAMYLGFNGRVKIASADGRGQERVLAFTEEGGFFGEMALVTGEPRSTDVVAATDTTVLELRKTDFVERVASPLGLRQVLRLLAERQSAVNARLLQRGEDEDSVGGSGARGKVFAVYSSRGGSGKTTVAVNLAVALAQQFPEQVVLLDLALTFGHTPMLFDVQPPTSLAAISVETLRNFDRDALSRYVVSHASTLRLMPGSIRPEEGEGVTQEHVQQVLHLLKRYFSYIVVHTSIVVDTSSNFADTTLAALEAADRIVFIMTPEATTIRNLVSADLYGRGLHPTGALLLLAQSAVWLPRAQQGRVREGPQTLGRRRATLRRRARPGRGPGRGIRGGAAEPRGVESAGRLVSHARRRPGPKRSPRGCRGAPRGRQPARLPAVWALTCP